MTFEYYGVEVDYEIFGNGYPCVLLHGWGCDKSFFKTIISQMPERKFIAIDLPPFGKSGKNVGKWNMFTYVNMIISLCEHLKLTTCDILGHSFGGRIAVLLGALCPDLVHSLVLVDSAGLKPKRSIKYFLKVYSYKIQKHFGHEVKNAGSTDYQNLPEEQKKVFVRIVNTYLDPFCRKIKAPTLIIYGKNDHDTPIYMAKKFKKYVHGSKLILLEDAGHFCFLDSPLLFYKSVKEFWEGL